MRLCLILQFFNEYDINIDSYQVLKATYISLNNIYRRKKTTLKCQDLTERPDGSIAC